VTHTYEPLSRPDLRGLAQRPLHREPIVLALPRRLVPGPDAPVRLADHDGAEWIAARESTGFQAVTEMAARAAGFEPRISFRVNSYEMVLTLVGAGFGVALVPRLAAVPHRGVRYAPIERPSGLARQIYATTRSGDRSPAVAGLLRHLEKALAG
jgi:DNA-binding transcriptional LysR family regulator